jgi:hypothetical protein
VQPVREATFRRYVTVFLVGEAALADPSLSLHDQVRMACALGAVFGGLFMAGDAFEDVSSAELGSLVKDAVRDLVTDRGA